MTTGLGALATALAKAQLAISAAPKTSLNPHFKSRYADLTSIWEACRDALGNHQIAVIQAPNFDHEGAWLETHLIHSSGEFIIGRFPLKPTKPDMQGFGSAISYAKRYSLAAMVGVVSEEDDDGNEASRKTPTNTGNAQGQQTKTTNQTVHKTEAPKGVESKTANPVTWFDVNNPAHVKSLTTVLEKKKITGQWANSVLIAMRGKSISELEAVIERCNPERADLPEGE